MARMVRAELGLTMAQFGVWFADRLDPGNPTLTVGECVRITGPLDVEAFRNAYLRAVRDTDCLHLRPAGTDAEPGQVLDRSEASLPVIELGPAEAQAWMADRLAEPMDLHADRLHQAALLVVAPHEAWWYQRYHQFLMDGYAWSLFRRVARHYNEPEQAEPFCDLRRLVAEETAYRTAPAQAADRAYWLDRLAGMPEPAGLTGKVNGPARSFLRTEGRLAGQTRAALDDLGKRAGARWSRVLIALVAAYLGRITDSGEVVLGIAVPGRTTEVARSTPARMSNLLPLQLSVSPRRTLRDLVQDVAQELREMLGHQRYRGEDLRRELGWAPTSPRHFGPAVNIVPFDYDLRLGGCRTEFRNLCAGPVEDLSITFLERRDARALPGGLRWGTGSYPGRSLRR